MIDNTLNPDFVRKFILDYFFEERQNLRFDLWVLQFICKIVCCNVQTKGLLKHSNKIASLNCPDTLQKQKSKGSWANTPNH